MKEMGPPVFGTFWVVPGALLAGPHPSRLRTATQGKILDSLLEMGVGAFVDLTPEGEYGMKPYLSDLEGRLDPAGREILAYQYPIEDGSVPSMQETAHVLDQIEAWLAQGRITYLHCHAGIGRTGTLAACYLIRSGLQPEQALHELNRLRQQAELFGRAPENELQNDFVRRWPEADLK